MKTMNFQVWTLESFTIFIMHNNGLLINYGLEIHANQRKNNNMALHLVFQYWGYVLFNPWPYSNMAMAVTWLRWGPSPHTDRWSSWKHWTPAAAWPSLLLPGSPAPWTPLTGVAEKPVATEQALIRMRQASGAKVWLRANGKPVSFNGMEQKQLICDSCVTATSLDTINIY